MLLLVLVLSEQSRNFLSFSKKAILGYRTKHRFFIYAAEEPDFGLPVVRLHTRRHFPLHLLSHNKHIHFFNLLDILLGNHQLFL